MWEFENGFGELKWLFLLFIAFAHFSCTGSSNPTQKDINASKDSIARTDTANIQNTSSPSTEILTFDWNHDGIMDTIFFNGVGQETQTKAWQQTVIKISGAKPLTIGDTPGADDDGGDYLFSDVKELLNDSYIKKQNSLNSKFVVRLAIDKTPGNIILLIKGYAYASDDARLYIIKLNSKGQPNLIYNQEQEFFDFHISKTNGKLEVIIPLSPSGNLDEFQWDTTVNGAPPDSYSRIVNKKGNIVQTYNPELIYHFTKDSMVIDTALSKSHNLSNNKAWAGVNPSVEYVVFYKSANERPVLYERKKFVNIWNNIK